jgi:hypothetical protein
MRVVLLVGIFALALGASGCKDSASTPAASQSGAGAGAATAGTGYTGDPVHKGGRFPKPPK